MSKPAGDVMAAALAWFAGHGWTPFDFQREVWRAVAAGESGLLHATTGAGKTYAVGLGAVAAFMSPSRKSTPAPLTLLWITPMRALAADTLRSLEPLLTALAPLARWSAGVRSGDTPAGERNAQNQRLPTVLVTTPESLSVLLARADAQDTLGSVRMVVVDEWHELLGNKRGVQVQLALARLKRWSAQVCVWGLSATLGNLEDAMHTLLGRPGGTLVRGRLDKRLVIDSLLPVRAERFPWAGHLGLAMLPQVVDEVAASGSTLVFTYTRSQAEIWYLALLEARP
jgi:ATP-dependent helicase Lhr and Lhr-like helicase